MYCVITANIIYIYNHVANETGSWTSSEKRLLQLGLSAGGRLHFVTDVISVCWQIHGTMLNLGNTRKYKL